MGKEINGEGQTKMVEEYTNKRVEFGVKTYGKHAIVASLV